MVGQVVVVFYWLQRGRFAEESKVVHGDGVGEECLQGVEHTEARAEDGDQ